MVQRKSDAAFSFSSGVETFQGFALYAMTLGACLAEQLCAVLYLPSQKSGFCFLQPIWFKKRGQTKDDHDQHEGNGAYYDFHLHGYSSS
jgi:hypothetical protein